MSVSFHKPFRAALAGAVVAILVLAAPAADAPSKLSTIPLTRIVLFTSSVGYFEHVGRVQGDANVELNFKVADVNDLLKSMVVQDFGGGHVSTVGYPSKEPLQKVLSSFAIDLSGNPTLAKLLEQIRGHRVEVDAPNKIAGTIVGVETHKKDLEYNKTIDVDYLVLLTDDGLKSIPLPTVSRIKLSNEKLDEEFRKALAVLSTARSTDKKTVSVAFNGQGERRVRIGYIQETPVWKTSYRLVLDDAKKAKDDADKPGTAGDAKTANGDGAFLQGWAIVENTTEEDWKDVSLSLISGRPISFIMDLYQPLFIPRPRVELEHYASIRPQTYGQDLASREGEFRRKAGAMADGRMMAKLRAPMPAAMAMPEAANRAEQAGEGEPRLDLAQGVQSAASAGTVGELFQYAIKTPVSLPRHQSAMLPIVNGNVKAKKLSIYNRNVDPKHPINGVKLTNSSGLYLMQGPITVFDGGTYAGDAKIEDIAPGSTRLLSYAIDLQTEVAPETKGHPERITSVRLNKGTLWVQIKYTREVDYTVKNSGDRLKSVYIEQPVDPAWKLVEPKEPAEKARNLYRFAVEAQPGEPAKLAVREERVEMQQVALTNADTNYIGIYLGNPNVGPKVKAALAEVVKQRNAIQVTATQRGQKEQELRNIEQEQARIRQNMSAIEKTSDLYNRYVKKLSDQEDQVEQLHRQVKELLDNETKLRKALDDYLAGLDLE